VDLEWISILRGGFEVDLKFERGFEVDLNSKRWI